MKAALDLRPGRFYKDRHGKIWCCYRRRDASAKHAAASCVRVCDNWTEHFYADGRYDSDAKRDLCLVEECAADGGDLVIEDARAVEKKLVVAYLAHRMSAPTLEGMRVNRMCAAKWAAWLWRQGFAVECSWIVCTGELEETPENRKLGLESDCEQVRRADVMALCGPQISGGMLIEAEAAEKIVDFTYLGLELPTAELRWEDGREITIDEIRRRIDNRLHGGALLNV